MKSGRKACFRRAGNPFPADWRPVISRRMTCKQFPDDRLSVFSREKTGFRTVFSALSGSLWNVKFWLIVLWYSYLYQKILRSFPPGLHLAGNTRFSVLKECKVSFWPFALRCGMMRAGGRGKRRKSAFSPVFGTILLYFGLILIVLNPIKGVYL